MASKAPSQSPRDDILRLVDLYVRAAVADGIDVHDGRLISVPSPLPEIVRRRRARLEEALDKALGRLL